MLSEKYTDDTHFLVSCSSLRDLTERPAFKAVTRVQIPSGTPNLISNLRFCPSLIEAQKGHKSLSSMRTHRLKSQCFRTDRADSSRHKRGTRRQQTASTSRCCGCLQKTNDAALCSSLLYCDCLGVRVQRDTTGRVTKQFLRHFDVRFVGSQQ